MPQCSKTSAILPAIAVLTVVYPASAVVVDFAVYGHLVSLWQVAGFALIVLASLGVNLDWGARGVGKIYN